MEQIHVYNKVEPQRVSFTEDLERPERSTLRFNDPNNHLRNKEIAYLKTLSLSNEPSNDQFNELQDSERSLFTESHKEMKERIAHISETVLIKLNSIDPTKINGGYENEEQYKTVVSAIGSLQHRIADIKYSLKRDQDNDDDCFNERSM